MLKKIDPKSFIHINISSQTLSLLANGKPKRCYTISSGKNGVGEQAGSECTPRGWHIIRAMIGADSPLNSVFVGRRASGEIWSSELKKQFPQRDWVLTRILWLSGLERGYNRLGQQDTMRRYIYIHGCPDDEPMGIPKSHGCIRMRNEDIVELFELVQAGLPVLIEE